MKKIRFIRVLILAFTAACHASTGGSRNPEPTSGVNRTPDISTGDRTAWIITPTTQQHRYHAATATLLELADSAGITTDSLRSTVDFTLSIARTPDSLSYATTIESISVKNGTRTGEGPMSTTLPFSFTGHIQENRLTITSPSKQSPGISGCSNEVLSVAPVIQRAVVQVPLALQQNQTWADSVSAEICSGSIPVTGTVSCRYRVLGETSSGVLIERQDKTISAGEGTQGQHRVKLRSNGTGTARLLVDSRTGALIESTGTHTATVVVTASGKDRIFRQTSHEQISTTN